MLGILFFILPTWFQISKMEWGRARLREAAYAERAHPRYRNSPGPDVRRQESPRARDQGLPGIGASLGIRSTLHFVEVSLLDIVVRK